MKSDLALMRGMDMIWSGQQPVYPHRKRLLALCLAAVAVYALLAWLIFF